MAFLYPSFLVALSAVAIPIILHLVQLRRAKRVAFSNVKFIKASQDVTSSQRKLKDLLILLCRILFISFLVLAFAQPFIPAEDQTSSSSTNSVGLVVDNSFSMQNVHTGTNLSLLDAAVQKSKALVDLFESNTGFYVYSNEGNMNRGLSTSSQEAVSLANAINFSSQSLSVPSQTPLSHLFLLSDMQQSSFRKEHLLKVDSTTQIHVVPIQPEDVTNVYVDTVFLQDEFLRVGDSNTLQVQIYNAGATTVVDCPVKLYINEQQVAALSLDLPPKQASHASINFKLTDANLSLAYVHLEDYPVEFDNSYYFVLAPSGGISIVEVTGGNSNLLEQVYKAEPLLRHSSFTLNNIDYGRAVNSDVIVLNGLNNIPGGIATTVSNFVNAGGTVVIIPSQDGSTSDYASLFNNLGVNAQLVNNTETKVKVVAPDRNSPFFNNIFSEFNKEIQMPSATRTLVWSRASEDILKFRGGAPFLSRFNKGKGKVFLMAAPLDEKYNTIVNHALLVPVMYKLAISGYKQEQNLAYAFDETSIRVPVVEQNRTEGVYKLVKDSLSFIPDQLVRGRDLIMTVPPGLNEAGFYDLTLQDSVITTLAFNYAKEESKLDTYTPDELKTLIGNERKNIHVYDYGDAFSVKSEFEKRYFGVKLWKYCLILCLVFLMAEIALIRFL